MISSFYGRGCQIFIDSYFGLLLPTNVSHKKIYKKLQKYFTTSDLNISEVNKNNVFTFTPQELLNWSYSQVNIRWCIAIGIATSLN